MSELLTTDAVEQNERLGFWREMICAAYVDLDAEPLSRGPFFGSVELSSWGETRLSTVTSDAQLVRRRPGSPRSDCLLSLQLYGSAQITQAGRSTVLGPGDCALYDATAPYELAFDDSFSQMVLQFPREALIARDVHIESTVARSCSTSQGLGAIAGSFIRSLGAYEADIPETSRSRLGEQALDMAVTALASGLDVPRTGDAVRSADRFRIAQYIDHNLCDPELTVNSIARAHGVSTRTLQKLFENEDLQLGDRIRTARVIRAKEYLRDPRRAHQPIGRIAYDLGFGSPSRFSRVFRAKTGCTPSEYRRDA